MKTIDRLRIEAKREPHEPIWREAITAIESAMIALESIKQLNINLRIELRDALFMAYGAEMNWPESARAAMGCEQ